MNRPAIAGMKYRSAIDGAGVGSGVAVAGASSTVKDVSWFDGQYPLLPANVAITVYLPVMSGDHAIAVVAGCVSGCCSDCAVVSVCVDDVYGYFNAGEVGWAWLLLVDVSHPVFHACVR